MVRRFLCKVLGHEWKGESVFQRCRRCDRRRVNRDRDFRPTFVPRTHYSMDFEARR
jgi:hypothetical protein